MTAEPDGRGYYVYGVIDADANVADAVAAAGAVDPASAPFVVTAAGVSAVVSAVPLDDFDEERLPEHLNDPEWLLPRVAAHEDVLEHALAAATVVPFRFGTVYRDEASVRTFLSDHAHELSATLGRLAGRIEVGAKVYVDRGRLAASLREADPAVGALEAEIAAAPEGRAYMLRRRADQVLDGAVKRFEQECAAASHSAFAGAAEDARLNPVRSADADESREMILNAAYLVEADTALRQVATNLEQRYAPSGVSFELTGPWPPYNFVEAEPA